MIKKRPRLKVRDGVVSFQYPLLQKHMEMMCMQRQTMAVNRLTRSRGGLVWWKVGEGKTRISLFLFAALQNAYEWSLPSICLVVCRRRAFYDWTEEIRYCFPESSVYCDFVPVHPLGSRPVFLLVSHAEVEKRFEELHDNQRIRFVILDELWLYANGESKRSKAVRNLTASRKSVGLSGTIMKARNTDEIYNQARAVHKHRMLAPNLTKFRTLHQRRIMIDDKFPKTYAKKGAYKRIMRDIREVADIHFPIGDRLIHEQFHNVPATKKQLAYFQELREFCSIDELDLEYDRAITISIKAQQIADGWIKTKHGDFIHVPTEKAEKLEDELSDILAGGHRAVVWCAFRYDVEYLADRLKVASLQMLGGEDFDVDRWSNGDIRVCLATEASGSSVNYFAQTPYAIYYSADYKWLHMQQSKGRTDRGRASKHKTCFYKYLQVVGSLDHHVYTTALGSGTAERKLIAAGIQRWLTE